MAKNRLSQLVSQAKGEDRTLREYARDSGVDSAIISKMISGTYIPKKPDTFLRLTSVDAAPRGGVTYEQLVSAADDSRAFQAGMTAGRAVTNAVLSAFGAFPLVAVASSATAVSESIKQKKKENSESEDDYIYTKEKLEKYFKKQKQFQAIALGIIVSTLVKKSITCQVGNVKELNLLGGAPDEFLKLSNQSISEWWLSFWAKDEQMDESPIVPKAIRAESKISHYAVTPADSKRKASIVVDDPSLFDALCVFKGQTSYRGNLSAVLIDTANVEIVKEVYLAHYDEADTSDELFVV